MVERIKKPLTTVLLALAVLAGGAGIAHAHTVYYKGVAVYWDHGRTKVVFSFSKVQTHRFYHSATANDKWSGWKSPGIVAYAEQFVGWNKAEAYWDCHPGNPHSRPSHLLAVPK